MTVAGGTATLNYNANKQLTSINMPNNRVIAFTYTDGKITRFAEAPTTGATTNNTSTFDFTYNAQNQITKCDLSLNGGTVRENNITYGAVVNNANTVSIDYRDGSIGGNAYNFMLTLNTTNKAVTAYSMSYSEVVNCPPNSVPVTATYNFANTVSGYTANSPKTIWAELNMPIAVRFFLNRYFLGITSASQLVSNPINVVYLSDVAPSTISLSNGGGGCSVFMGNSTHNYTHTTNNKNVVTATTVAFQGQNPNPVTYNYTQNCD
jgi:hypothetical protein